ncbi:MAG: excinuclease ABC subunit UvrA [Planctomycetota bacterium]|nr:excinuclease ABC subunit UvrA [Planctomycetota bacterium]
MDAIRIRGAAEHNLKDLDLDVPHGQVTVFTGISGSGKSSLAFDTIYKEGRRRFLESLSSYARRFLGGFEKPRVESIDGLSPAIAIEQRTVGRSPRSTVGTVTEIYDHLRLLYARLGLPHCHLCGQPVRSQSAEQVVDQLLYRFAGRRALICAPIVRDRRGEFRRELATLRRDGYVRVRVDGVVQRLDTLGRDPLGGAFDRRKSHTLEVVHDRLPICSESRGRLVEGIEKCFALADGIASVVMDDDVPGESAGEREHLFSGRFACPSCGVDLPELEPRFFSFNTPQGACEECRGLGVTPQVDPEQLVADPSLPLRRGGLALFGSRGHWLYPELERDSLVRFLSQHGLSLDSSWGDLGEDERRSVLRGDGEFRGLLAAIHERRREDGNFLRELVRDLPCEVCEGRRLGPLARAVTFEGWTLPDLCALPIDGLDERLAAVELSGAAAAVGEPVLREIRLRLRFLVDVGLNYLTLERPSRTLSGGEAHRIRLASQVGAGLRGVVYVLDEPSIGLHPRDNRRLLATLRRLRDLGNTVLVVEHDREMIESADHVVDLGPGAGTLGGYLVAQGLPGSLRAAERSITGDYLAGRRSVEVTRGGRRPGDAWLEVYGASHNNLKEIDVRLPLGLFVVVTGVSGSGKSSLVNQVLRPAVLRKLGSRGAEAGAHRAIRGYQHVDKLISIDQSPIGKSPRSNPATYTKMFGLIRELFARLPEARARGYSAGRFSFNVDGGRCPECGGAGVTVVDMQFLAPVEIVCDACGGRRYNRETLEILFRGRSVSEVLEFTVAEALDFFQDQPRITRSLETLSKVGLGYIRLGQPSTTLSGGESQRLKLSAELMKRETGRTLYILDEPTTGLHFEDVRLLLEVLHELVERQNSVIVIEHNLDVIRTADYVVDLGPGAGDEGGEVVALGSPEEVMKVAASHTGVALRERLDADGDSTGTDGATPPGDVLPAGVVTEAAELSVEGATLHNLRSVDVKIPRGQITVITGVSGSGKTSLAFDTIFAEGQRRYIESLSTYARQFLGRLQSPPVEKIRGLAPAIAIDQKSLGRGYRSTVATATEIHDYLRLLYARVGRPHCPRCGEELAWTSPTRLARALVEGSPEEKLYVSFPLSVPERGELALLLKQQLKAGYTRVLVGRREVRLDEEEASTLERQLARELEAAGEGDPRARLLVVVDRLVLRERAQSRLADSLEQAFSRGGGIAAVQLLGHSPVFHSRTPACRRGHFSLAEELTPRMFSPLSVEGACPRCRGRGLEKRVRPDLLFRSPGRSVVEAIDPHLRRFLTKYRPSSLQLLRGLLKHLGVPPERPYAELDDEVRQAILHGTGETPLPLAFENASYETKWPGLSPLIESWLDEGGPVLERSGLERYCERSTCGLCGGRKLREEFLAVRVGGLNIHELCELDVRGVRRFFESLELRGKERIIAREVVSEIDNRLRFLDDVGLGYLTLDRPTSTLAGGEAQRIRLASQLGNRLVGVIYVLDEPTIGLHARDTQRLLASLRELRDQGNTIILVEHDRETIEAADQVIDLGPGAGADGGRVVASGTPAEVAAVEESLTGQYLRGERAVTEPRRRRLPGDSWLRLDGVHCHNLRDVDAAFPLGVFTAVTGVSGSGKSSLVLDVLARVLAAHRDGEALCREVVRDAAGLDAIRRVVVVDQRPIGRSPKSTPATYTGLWTHVRELYASLPTSRVRGYGVARFSFNSPEGRCAACDGQGARLVEMQFLSDVWVECDVCRGRRFEESTLDVRFKGKDISEVLDLEVEAALELFENQPRTRDILKVLVDVGLGYVKLGQSSVTLSGGEAQRVKLAGELVESREGGRLTILDEPTTGLHFEDIRRLLEIFQRLVEGGNTLIVIEHQLDVVAAADWVIELGPEGGDAGGRIVVVGSPEDVAASGLGHTSGYLKKVLAAAPARSG